MLKMQITSIWEMCNQCKNETKGHAASITRPINSIAGGRLGYSQCKFDSIPEVVDKEVRCYEFLPRTNFILVKKKLLLEDRE